MWGSPTADPRGEYKAEWMATLGLEAADTGLTPEPTFVRGQSRVAIDITLATARLMQRLDGWRVVVEEESMSWHRFIQFRVGGTARKQASRFRAAAGIHVGLFDDALSLLLTQRASRSRRPN